MAITVTEAALNRLEVLKKKRQTPDAVLRLGVRGGAAARGQGGGGSAAATLPSRCGGKSRAMPRGA